MAEQGEGIKRSPLFKKAARVAAAAGVLAAGYVGEGIKPVNADAFPSPTATSTSTATPTGTPTPDAVGTQLAQERSMLAELTTQTAGTRTATAREAARKKELADVQKAVATAKQELEDLTKPPTTTSTPTASPTNTKTATPTATATPTSTPDKAATNAARATMDDASARYRGGLQATATRAVELSATPTPTPTPTPDTRIPVIGGMVNNVKESGIPVKEIAGGVVSAAATAAIGAQFFKRIRRGEGNLILKAGQSIPAVIKNRIPAFIKTGVRNFATRLST